jgi:uncharacterized protein YndB with AHSA1/START domain
MPPTPTGRLITTDGRRDLELRRVFEADIADVWDSITDSERTARWFASWTGDARPGNTIRYQLSFEGVAPEGTMVIDACEAPRHLAITTTDEAGSWRLEAHLTEVDGSTVLVLTQHLDEGADVGSVGPGWEYYLDMLVASRLDAPLPDFDDYYPAQQAYYEEQG